MTVEEWIAETKTCTLAFTDSPEGVAIRARAEAANPSWKYLSEYGREVSLCAFANPIQR